MAAGWWRSAQKKKKRLKEAFEGKLIVVDNVNYWLASFFSEPSGHESTKSMLASDLPNFCSGVFVFLLYCQREYGLEAAQKIPKVSWLNVRQISESQSEDIVTD